MKINRLSFSNVKLFSPLAENDTDDRENIQRTVKRNRAMMKETSSTITVPTTFMFQILRSMYRSQNSEDLSEFDDDV